MAWLKGLALGGLLQETLAEYLVTYESLKDRVERLDRRIAELSQGVRYQERVGRLGCFLGIKAHIALALLAEIGDFARFGRAGHFASFLGLTPGESSSGEQRTGLGITKAGNSHLRRLLVEAAQSIARGRIGYKSKDLKARQRGQPSRVVAYADRANERLRRRYSRMIQRGAKRNVAVTALARELACFVWGMLTDRLAPRGAGGEGLFLQHGQAGGRCLICRAKREQRKRKRWSEG